MSYIGKDGTGATKYWQTFSGDGSIGSPYVPTHKEYNSSDILTSVQLLDDVVYTEDGALGTPKGIPMMLRRDDTLSTLTPAEDDAVVGRCNSRGAQWFIHDGAITANIGTSGSLALDATLTGGTQKAILRGGAKGSTSAADVTSTASGSNHQLVDVAIYDSSGTQITSFGGSGGTASNFGSAVPSTGTAMGASDGTNMQNPRLYDLDTGAGTNYVLGASIRLSANGGSVEGGTASNPLRIDPTGSTTQPVNGTVTSNIGTSGSLALDATLTGGTAKFVGNVAHGASDSGNPNKIGLYAVNANRTKVSNTQRVDAIGDLAGRQVMVLNNVRELIGKQATTITSSTSETTIVTAGGSGVFRDISHLTFSNSNSTTDTLVTLRDSTGGSSVGSFNLPARGGIVIPYPTPNPQTTANNNWTAQCGTSVASIYCMAQYVNNI